MIRVVALDLDDTLWELRPVMERAQEKLADWLRAQVPEMPHGDAGMPAIRNQLLAADPGLRYRLTELRQRVIEKALTNSRVPGDRAGHLAAGAMEVFLTARNEVEFFPGALDAIREIAQHYRLGALTNGNASVHRLGLADHFSFAFSAEEVDAGKPEPDLFLRALEYTGCAPHEMVYVGDDPVKDVDAANRAGLRTVWLRHDALREPGATTPDQVIDDIRKLPDAIRTLDGRQASR